MRRLFQQPGSRQEYGPCAAAANPGPPARAPAKTADAVKQAVVCFALACAGCASRPAPVAPAETASAHWNIALSVVPAAPRSLDPVQFNVQVAGENGRPITGAAVGVRLEMPAMDMGQDRVVLHETAQPGTYTGTGRFSMPGDWQVKVQASKGKLLQTQSLRTSVR